MKWISRILLFLLLILQNSCEELYFYDCADCLEVEPIDCILNINVNSVFNSTNYYTITVYQGKVEDNIIIEQVSSRQNINVTVQLNKEYTVEVRNTVNGIDYISISSTTPKVKYMENYCEVPCYFIKNNTINAKIKYY